MTDSETFLPAETRPEIENQLMEALCQRQHEWASAGDETAETCRHRFMDPNNARLVFRSVSDTTDILN